MQLILSVLIRVIRAKIIHPRQNEIIIQTKKHSNKEAFMQNSNNT